MANAFYNQGREKACAAGLTWVSGGDGWRFNLIKTGYSVDFDLHLDVADIAASLITTNPHAASLTSPTLTDGVLDAADQAPAFTGPNDSGAADYLVLAEASDTDANDELLIYIDTAASGLPVSPNGGNLNLTFNASGIATVGAV